MKKIILSAGALILGVCNAFSTVYTVNNQSGFDADFSSLATAISAANSGDSLYIEPSSISYGAVVIDKQLFLIGPGHNPDFSPYNAYMSSISLSSNSTGTILKGLSFGQLATYAGTVVNDIVVSGCYCYAQNPISLSGSSTMNNWIFEGNVITSQTNGINLASLGANAIFRNNYLEVTAGSIIIQNAPSGSVFDHNVMIVSGNPTFGSAINGLNTNIEITNNILLIGTTSASPPASGCLSCLWENNITYSSTLNLSPLPGTNFNNIDPEFVNYPTVQNTYSYAYDFHFTDSSVGIGAATDGSDIGLYGGIFNFSATGADGGIPEVVNFTIATSTAPSGGTITIHLNANGSGN